MPKGRPAISGKTKNKLLQIRLDESELAAITRRAVEHKKGTATYARDLLLEDAAMAETVKKR